MRLFPNAELKKSGGTGQLTFTVTRQENWLESFVSPLVLVGFCVWSFRHANWWVVGFSAIGVVTWIANKLRGSETEMMITPSEVAVAGNLGRLFRSELRLSPEQITSMEYWSAGEDGRAGLYIKTSWNRVCALPGLSEQQTNEVLDEIYQHFPRIRIGDRNASSILFGSSDPIELSLSKPMQKWRFATPRRCILL